MNRNSGLFAYRKYITAAIALLFVIAIIAALIPQNDTPSTVSQNQQENVETVEEKRTITISAVGDLTLAADRGAPSGVTFNDVFEDEGGDTSYFFRNVSGIFSHDDLTIGNLECALSDLGTRADKSFAFRGDPSYVQILKDGSFEAVNLANNHSADYGQEALSDTVANLDAAGVLSFNGTDTVVTEINGIKVGLVGVNALNEEGTSQLVPAIQSVKTQGAQLVIASIHWGVEKAEEPESEQVTLAHSAIDAGADLILGHHPHVVQGIEKYNGRYIVYSLGNFCFGGNTNPSDKDSMIFQQTFSFTNGTLVPDDNTQIIPCRISGSDSVNDYQPDIATGEDRTDIIDKITERSRLVGTDAALLYFGNEQTAFTSSAQNAVSSSALPTALPESQRATPSPEPSPDSSPETSPEAGSESEN